METNNKKFCIVIADNTKNNLDVQFLKHVFNDKNVEIVNSSEIKNQKIDFVLFTGGEDVFPDYYYEPVGKYTSYNSARDKKESNLFHNISYKIPKLGICRGAQFLTVMNGGKLIQHVTGHSQDHNITFNNGLEIPMTSSHHQMMFPFDLEKEKYELIAHSTWFKSNTYLNGENKEKELPRDFLEPEIVYYPNTNSLCIQGHPEWMDLESKTVQIIKNLINSKLFKNEI